MTRAQGRGHSQKNGLQRGWIGLKASAIHKKQAFSVPTFSSLRTIEVKTFSGDGDTPTRTASIVGRAMERAHGWQTSVNLNE